MRIAFLTPEYPSEYSDRGRGLGTYLYRMAQLLKQSGHEPEVFVSSRHLPRMFIHDGICVHRVNWQENQLLSRLIYLGCQNLARRLQHWSQVLRWIFEARAYAAALERRHSEAPFSLVQSADWRATGLLIRHRPERIHVVRCSSAADLYNSADGIVSKLELCRGYLERSSMKRADLAYAPSRFIAQYFIDTHGINVEVVRPPQHREILNLSPPSMQLPSRFLFHFGYLMDRKGTALLAQALPLAWRTVPDLTMVWSGQCWNQQKLDYWRSLWGDRIKQIHITGPLPKSEIYSVLKQAEAAVLPSQADNLPNTVIESLMFGIPVIGSRGASIDELVDEGINGHLVELGDANGLAEALVKIWKGNSPVRKGFEWDTVIANEMRPERAVENLVGLAKSEPLLAPRVSRISSFR